MIRAFLFIALLHPSLSWAVDPAFFAVVPLDGPPGTSSRDMQVVARGVAEALAADPRVSVVHGDALVRRLTAGKQREIQEARDAFQEGTLLLREGDPDIGLAFLAESLAAHDRAGSAVVRREEMADVAFSLAEALLAVDRDAEARDALAQALRLLPDYLDVRATQVQAELRDLARDIEVELLARPPRVLSAEGARSLAADLQVDHVVHGVVAADGQLTLHLYRPNGDRVHAETRPGPFLARRLGDPWYTSVADRLRAAGLGEPLPPAPDVPMPPPDPVLPPSPPPVPERRRTGPAAALGVTAGVLAAGAATAAVLLTRPVDPQDAWTLQITVR